MRSAWSRHPRQGVPLWIWWIPVVWVISFPWSDLTRQAQWHRVHLMPFSDPADKPVDLLANVVLFVPFGYSFVRRRGSGGLAALGLLAGAAVSVSAEALQLFSTDRYPSGTDVVAAAAGAGIGILVSALGRKRGELRKP